MAPCEGGHSCSRPGTWRYDVPGARGAPVDLRTDPRAACTTAGGFAMWGGLFSTFDCALLAIRQKDDPINPIMSGAITGGVLAARGQSAEPAALSGSLAPMSWSLQCMCIVQALLPACRA